MYKQIEDTAKKYGMIVNSDTERVEVVLGKLKVTQGYCPCMPARNDATMCPCLFMRKHKACRCGLYVRDKDA